MSFLFERIFSWWKVQTIDLEANYRQAVLGKVLLVAAGTLGVFSVYYLVRWMYEQSPLHAPGLVAVMALICLLAHRLVQRNRLALVSHLLPSSLLLVMTISVFTTVFSPTDLLGFAAAVLVAGLLIDVLVAYGYVAISLLVLWIADSHGTIPDLDLAEYLLFTLSLSLLLLFVWMVTKELEIRAEREHEMAVALANYNQTLEEQVTERTAELQVEVAERRRAETELRRSEERYRTVVENQTELICRLSPAGTITFVNQTFQFYFNVTPAEVEGTHFLQWIPTRHRAMALARFGELQQNPHTEQYEQPMRLLGGDILWIQWVAHPILDEHDELVEFLVVGRDVTEHKAMEAALRHAKLSAESASQAKSQFVANMSHEIRTPMNAVIGLTNLLLDSPLNEQQRDFVETIRSSGVALMDIVNNILDFSKIEAGYLELEDAPFLLHTCIEETLDLFASTAAQSDIELAYQIAEGTPDAVSGDFVRLRQILTNLVGNGVKFTQQGAVVVMVDSQQAGKKWRYHFQVRDTGVGIPTDKMNLLFSTFSQVDASITRNYGGTGLGLVICRRLSQAMGGDMWVESEEGIGSTFHFTICLSVQDSTAGSVQEGTPIDSRALVVDDNDTSRAFLCQQLRSHGMDVVAVADGEAALARLEQGEQFDLAIVDMQMPNLDGYQLTERLRNHPSFGARPVILLTTPSSPIRPECAPDLADVSTLSKPIRMRQLSDVLLFIIDKRVSTPAAPVMLFDADLARRVPLRILVAEDNVVNQKVAVHLLARLGYHTDVVANGVEVLDALERQRYDLILMDLQMPEMDGYTATRQIRSQGPQVEQPRIVAMTAHAMDDTRAACLDAGMDDCITKPVRIKELVHVLEASVTSIDAATE